MIKIKKLTPVQIEALTAALPGLVGAEMLTTTLSTATFLPASRESRKAYPHLDTDMDLPVVRRIVLGALTRTKAKPLNNVLAKLDSGKDIDGDGVAA